MNQVFGTTYAGSYDDFYREKDYEAECLLVERIIKEFSPRETQSILDLGCGTGRHAEIWAEHGFQVTGVDRSETMLQQAVERTKGRANARFLVGDVRNIRLRSKFDVVALMFAVLGYQTQQQDLERTLETVREHLQPGGLLVFDVWYGPAVLAQGPEERVKTIQLADGELRRRAQGVIHESSRICEVHYKVERISEGTRSSTEETHSMRFFFREELEGLLRRMRFDLLRLGGFPSFEDDPDENTWNAIGVARAL